jgi:dienelactone hydrolase
MNSASAMPYVEHGLMVTRHARWGRIGDFSEATTSAWIALHGYAQLAAGFARSASWPVSADRVFVFPEALQRFYADAPDVMAHAESPVGATWMTRETRDDDIADNHAYLDALWELVRAASPTAVLNILGFSQGGATATRWAAERAEKGSPPARLVLWANTLPPDVDLGPDAPLRRVSTSMVFGTRDRWATAERIAAERERLAAAAFPVTVYQFDGGHRLDDELLSTIVSS